MIDELSGTKESNFFLDFDKNHVLPNTPVPDLKKDSVFHNTPSLELLITLLFH